MILAIKIYALIYVCIKGVRMYTKFSLQVKLLVQWVLLIWNLRRIAPLKEGGSPKSQTQISKRDLTYVLTVKPYC